MPGIKHRFNNLKNIGKNLQTIQNNPYMHQKFMYKAYKYVIILVGALIMYQIGKMIYKNINTSSGNSMTMLTSAFMLLVGIIIFGKLWRFMTDMKKNLMHYEAHPTNITSSLEDSQVDSMKVIDDLLLKYDKKGGKI